MLIPRIFNEKALTLPSVFLMVAFLALACSSGQQSTPNSTIPSVTVPAPTESQANASPEEPNPTETPTPTGLPEATKATSGESQPDVSVLSRPHPLEYPEGSDQGPWRFTYPTSPWTKTNFNKRAVPLIEFFFGGPPPDGIPPLDDPKFETIADADEWITDFEPLMVFVHDGIAKGYPLQVMVWHEIVNDTIGDLPILVSY